MNMLFLSEHKIHEICTLNRLYFYRHEIQISYFSYFHIAVTGFFVQPASAGQLETRQVYLHLQAGCGPGCKNLFGAQPGGFPEILQQAV